MSDKKENKKSRKKKQFHKDLEGFDIKINEFGEIQSNYDVDKLNAFLNQKLGEARSKDTDKDDEQE